LSDVTRILQRIEAGDPRAAEKLLPLVYDELRKLAAARLANERAGQTLSATSLVHEAYIRLVDVKPSESEAPAAREGEAIAAGRHEPRAEPRLWDSRGHFFAAAAEAMRRILVESARRKKQLKRGGDLDRVDFTTACLASEGPSLDLLALDEALDRLAAADAAKAELVKLRYFAGLTMAEAAQALGISLSTAERHWAFAKSWLYTELQT
jgi:RNA polymerase sigma factor (sigma-70 family)